MSAQSAKFSVEGGTRESEGTFLALGSYTLPVGTQLGLQMDGAVGAIDEKTMGGGGLHLFTRDPEHYLIGVYGSYHTWDSIDIWRTAAEVELYSGRFSFTALAGYENVDVPSFSDGLAVLNADDGHAFANLQLAYYPVDNLKLSGGYRYVSEMSLATASAEYLIQGSAAPISVFAKADVGEESFDRVTGGLKVYFGADPNKTLIQRHRTEDPQNYVPEFPVLHTAGGNGGLPICVADDDDYVVTSPSNGQCICGSNQPNAGNPAQSNGYGGYSCSN